MLLEFSPLPQRFAATTDVVVGGGGVLEIMAMIGSVDCFSLFSRSNPKNQRTGSL